MTEQAEQAFPALLPYTDGTLHSQAGLVGRIFDELDVGLVSTDVAHDFAHVNETAAGLLKTPAGETTARTFNEVLRQLARRALNHADVAGDWTRLREDPAATLKTTWQFEGAPTHLGVVCKPAPYPGFDGRIWAFYDNSFLARTMEASSQTEALLRTNADSMLDPQVLLEGVWKDGTVVDLLYRDVNRATCEYLGLSREEMVGHSILRSLPNIDGSGLMSHYTRCAQTGEPVILDAFPYHNELLGALKYYDVRAAQARPGWITLTWRDVTERSELSHKIAESEEHFRLLAENMADVVVRLDDDGTMTWISNSVENVLGATADHWLGQKVFDFAPHERRAEARENWARVVADGVHVGRAMVYGADGTPHTIHTHSKPFYDAEGRRDGIVASFRIIDAEVAAEERARGQLSLRDAQNQSLTRRLQRQTERLTAELESAARYVGSILPGELTGPVWVTSRYVPSRQLSGDSYDYRWIDDDHLIAYLVDVSGHGIEPALLSVSVHNVLRSGTFGPETLGEPGEVLTELNRLFQMDQHGGNYFTVWYGVYQRSTRTLRFATAGHPPALAMAPGDASPTLLATDAIPIGILEETEYDDGTYTVPAGAEILLYSDGAFELTLPGNEPWSLRDFTDLYTHTTTAPDWTLDQFIARLQDRSESGMFEDDCTLVRLNIP